MPAADLSQDQMYEGLEQAWPEGLRLPHLESNAVLVDGARSGTGQALAVMGPQVGYYTPEVLLE